MKKQETTLKVRELLQGNHNKSALKVQTPLILRGSILSLALALAMNVWLSPSQPQMAEDLNSDLVGDVIRDADPPDPDLVLRDADSSDTDLVLLAADPPEPDKILDADPPEPDKVLGADPPEPDLAP